MGMHLPRVIIVAGTTAKELQRIEQNLLLLDAAHACAKLLDK